MPAASGRDRSCALGSERGQRRGQNWRNSASPCRPAPRTPALAPARQMGLGCRKIKPFKRPKPRGRGGARRDLRYKFPVRWAEGRMEQSGADRRSLLKLGAAALTGAAVSPGNGAAQNNPRAAQGLKSLPRVDIAADRVTRRIAGLRPFRPSGFVVRAERLGEKTVIHNYGHGGCGVSLSWGTADMAARLALETPHRQAAVIGCGAVGLATARLLQDRGFEVAIYAKELPPDTTSNVAAALFGVTSLVDDAHQTGEVVGRIKQAARFAHRYHQNFVGDRYGVRWIRFFLIGDEPQDQPWDFAITPELYPLTPLEPGDNPFPRKYASSFPGIFIETNIYLPQMLADFLLAGGKLHVQAYADPRQLARAPPPLIR